MAELGQMLRAHVDVPWLPRGGRTEVVLAEGERDVADPTFLVRLLPC